MSILVSIVIPLYNTPIDYFTECLNSLQRQKIKSIETIIVNDKSTIDYMSILQDYKDLNITLLNLSQNSGPGVARHKGVNIAKGKYLFFIDSDDVLIDDTALSLLLSAAARHPDYDMICGQVKEELSNGIQIEKQSSYSWCYAKLYKKSFLDKNKINFNSTRANEDNSFCTLCSIGSNKICWISQFIYLWKWRENSITRENDQQYHYTGFKGYVENMIWVFEEAKARHWDNREQFYTHTLVVYFRIYFHCLDVLYNKGWQDVKEILYLGHIFYEKCYSKISKQIIKSKAKELYMQIVKNEPKIFSTVICEMSFPEFEYRTQKQDYNQNENYSYHMR